MSNLTTSILVFASLFGAALLGMFFGRRLPEHHLDPKSSDAIKMGMALTGTMAALLLSLQLGSAKASYDTTGREVQELSTNLILLDRTLAFYGPEAQSVRDRIRKYAEKLTEQLWPSERKHSPGPSGESDNGVLIYTSIHDLNSGTDERRAAAKAQALNFALAIGQTRWLIAEAQYKSTSMPLIFVLSLWLSIIFLSYGLLAPRNGTVISALFASAGSIACAIFLLLELQSPFSGVLQTSSEALKHATALLGH